MKQILKKFAFLVFSCFWCWLAFLCGMEYQKNQTVQERQQIPTFREIQQLLVNKGYDIGEKGVDGDIGAATKAAWERALSDQWHIAIMEREQK